jgi:hypothetical protein
MPRIIRRSILRHRNEEERRKRSPVSAFGLLVCYLMVTTAPNSANEPETCFRPEFKASFGTAEFFLQLVKTHIHCFSLDAPNQLGPWTEALEKSNSWKLFPRIT